MRGIVAISDDLVPVQAQIAAGLARVQAVFEQALESDLPPVSRLCRHVERYRGKMLRPTLVLVCGMAAHPEAPRRVEGLLNDAHATVGAVCEMVHMATLVHDDVLDEAETRRRGQTVNRLYGNEAAVILGDHLIASAYRLCSTIDLETALAVGRASREMCSGELLQLHHRDDLSLDEATYFEIIERKTAALIAASCALGARHSGASGAVCTALEVYGRRVGAAFQIQDDVLDLTGREAVVGKPLRQDAVKGKLTLPLIHHLAACEARQRGRSLRLLERLADDQPVGEELRAAVESTGSLRHALDGACRLVESAKAALRPVPDSPARRVLLEMADAVVARAF